MLKDKKASCGMSSSTVSRISAIQEAFKQQNDFATSFADNGVMEQPTSNGNSLPRRVSVRIQNGQGRDFQNANTNFLVRIFVYYICQDLC
jgi:cytochrome oxidase Cu insertion factor (SCO1/SenC/PrrC family)